MVIFNNGRNFGTFLIHEQQTLSAVSKFNYLKSVLKGSALSTIVGIPLTNDNYALAVRLLQEKYGQKEAIVGVLYSKLQNLPKANSKFADIQRTSETIEKLLRQLEAQGESINEQKILIQQIISKYPSEVIVKLEETKEPVVPWSVESLRKAIVSYIAVQENVQRYVSTNNPNVRGSIFCVKANKAYTGFSETFYRNISDKHTEKECR